MEYSKIFFIIIALIVCSIGCSDSPPQETPKGGFTVLVIDEQQTPLPSVAVTLRRSNNKRPLKKITGDNGTVLFAALPSDEKYIITLYRDGFYPEQTPEVDLVPGRTIFVRLLMRVNREKHPGRWMVARSTPISSPNDTQKKKIEKLESLSYLTGHKTAPVLKNVTRFDKQKAYSGLNLYCSGHAPEAVLMDMEGKELHKWRYDIEKLWKRDYPPGSSGHLYWRHVRLFPDGSLLAIYEGQGLVYVDQNSNLIWSYNGKAHHDLFVRNDGSIYVLTREASVNPKYNPNEPILDDYITHLSPEGKKIRRVSLLKCLETSTVPEVSAALKRMKKKGDILHTNTVEELTGTLQHKNPAFKKGNVLVSILYLDLIAVVDMEKETVVWAMTGLWRRQHKPMVLKNRAKSEMGEMGEMMIFDNLYGEPPVSRVLKFKPFEKTITWEYRGSSEAPFYTGDCGCCQPLANGNVLITESNNGRAFEVTPDKKIVWEFYSPKRAGKNKELIATLFEMERLPGENAFSWLK